MSIVILKVRSEELMQTIFIKRPAHLLGASAGSAQSADFRVPEDCATQSSAISRNCAQHYIEYPRGGLAHYLDTVRGNVTIPNTRRARGAMDNASAYGAEDSRFESWRARLSLFLRLHSCYFNIVWLPFGTTSQ